MKTIKSTATKSLVQGDSGRIYFVYYMSSSVKGFINRFFFSYDDALSFYNAK